MINSAIHHVGLSFSDVNAAEQYFDALLVDFMGLTKESVWEARAGWKGRGIRVYLYPGTSCRQPGVLHHLALTARNKDEVDAFARWAAARGWAIAKQPQSYSEYGGDYYAVFFHGPEGLRLELVHLTEEDEAVPM